MIYYVYLYKVFPSTNLGVEMQFRHPLVSYFGLSMNWRNNVKAVSALSIAVVSLIEFYALRYFYLSMNWRIILFQL